MNILLIHQFYLEKEDGGGSRFNEMTKIWSAKGHRVTVLSGMVHYCSGKKYEKYSKRMFYKHSNYYNNVNVVRCHVSEAYNTNFFGRLWAYLSFMFTSLYAGIFITKDKYDLILVTSPPLFVGVTGVLLSIIKRIPFVFEIRDLWPESAIDTGVLKNKFIIRLAYIFEKFIYRRARMINVLTPAYAEKLINDKNVNEDKIIIIPNAADFKLAENQMSTFDSIKFREELGFSEKFVITYVGAHGVANHLIQLLQVADKIRDTDIVFQLIGDGMQKDMLIKYAEEKNINNVIFRDSVSKEEVFNYIIASDLGVSVLRNVETFKTIYSNKTFDYMSCKIPVLMLIDGVSRQLIEDAECGKYAEPENIEDIEEAILSLRNLGPNKLKKMGGSGYNFAKTNFDREVLAQGYIEHLAEISSAI